MHAVTTTPRDLLAEIRKLGYELRRCESSTIMNIYSEMARAAHDGDAKKAFKFQRDIEARKRQVKDLRNRWDILLEELSDEQREKVITERSEFLTHQIAHIEHEIMRESNTLYRVRGNHYSSDLEAMAHEAIPAIEGRLKRLEKVRSWLGYEQDRIQRLRPE